MILKFYCIGKIVNLFMQSCVHYNSSKSPNAVYCACGVSCDVFADGSLKLTE